MGKMKEIFMEQQEQERLIREAVEAFMDDDWQYQEYLKTQGKAISQKCKGDCDECQCEGESATQEEVQANHDAWWDSLTDEQKQQLYDDKEKAFELSVEEMNHDLGFGK